MSAEPTKVAVVTGSTRGIGLGLASELAARGCRVVLSGRDQQVVDRVVADLGARHGQERVTGKACDVTDADQVQALWDAAVATFGRVDVWVSNAGVSHRRAPLHELDSDEVTQVVATNLLGALHGARVALRGMVAQAGGQLWNVEGYGSDGMTTPGIAVYGATKRAVKYLAKALAKEAKGTGVQVCTLSPGIVATDLLARDYDGQPEQWEKAKKVFNILGDEVGTVAPFLADGVLGTDRNGGRVAWLTKRKALARFATAPFRRRELALPEPAGAATVDLTDAENAEEIRS
jgi:NAD(P)-dependent dehydrogenase (short-subunit alcohol dehydrogenase family)